MVTISYAITVKDELAEIQQLISLLSKYAPQNGKDEIVVLWDRSGDSKVWEYLCSTTNCNLIEYAGTFNKNFADWKNYLNSLCSNEWVLNLDADELPNEILLNNLHYIIENNDCEAYWLPRENYVKGITQEHIQKWGWNFDEKQRINYPDPQLRLYKNDPERIKWGGKVHERIEGYKTIAHLPHSEEYSLYHYKSIERQEKQNNFYSII
jgi:hypothetical protein